MKRSEIRGPDHIAAAVTSKGGPLRPAAEQFVRLMREKDPAD
jgi:hypothetical protein